MQASLPQQPKYQLSKAREFSQKKLHFINGFWHEERMEENAQPGPSIWVVSDGRAGNAAQVRAIAAALREPSRLTRLSNLRAGADRTEPMTLTPKKPWTWLPSRFWPSPLNALPKEQRAIFSAERPTIWIGAGRRTAPYSALMKQKSAGATFVVHVLNPHMPPSKFDLLVTPAHDGLSGENIISTIGSPSYFSSDQISAAKSNFAHLENESDKTAIVILGGHSKAHTFTKSAAERLKTQLRGLAEENWKFRITASRRTPDNIARGFSELADELEADFWQNEKDGPNPYLAWLIHSNVAIVTEDSSNMLSDAAYFGLPIHIAKLEGGSPKFDRLHASFIERGCAKWFAGKLNKWTYDPLKEAERIADFITDAVLRKFS